MKGQRARRGEQAGRVRRRGEREEGRRHGGVEDTEGSGMAGGIRGIRTGDERERGEESSEREEEVM